MKPIKLELMGLNSYTDRQTVDFEKLTSRGVFGIFGNTGSGKSTILDAITIALYGDISRDTTDYINTSSDKAVVKFEFEIGSKNNRNRYFVERTIKNTPTGGTKTTRVLLGEIKCDGNINVLADKVGEVKNKIQEIIGLTSDDFTRSVVLPQGKFSEFLKLQDRDRRKMLERIFNLSKYGEKLSNKVKVRRSQAKEKITSLNGKLSQHEGMTEELYEDTREELLKAKKLEKTKNEDLLRAEKEYEENKVIFEDQKSLKKYIDRKSQLDEKEKEINIKREEIKRSERAEVIIPHINDIKVLEKDINENSNEVEKLEVIIKNIKKEIDFLSIRYEEAKKEKNEKIPLLIEEKGKLQRGIELEEKLEVLNDELKALKVEIDNDSKEKEKNEKQINDLQKQADAKYKQIQESYKKIESLTISTTLKNSIIEAYSKEDELKKLSEEKEVNSQLLKEVNKRIEELKFKNIDIEKNKTSINEKLKRLLEHQESLNKNCPGDNKLISNEKEYLHNLKSKLENTKDYEKQIKSIKDDLSTNEKVKFDNQRYLNESSEKLERINKSINEMKKEQGNLIFKNMAAYLREELKENEPCPVCGSTHHEKIYSSNNFEEAKLVEEKIKKLEEYYNREKNNYDELALKNREINSVENLKRNTLSELESKLGDYNSSSLQKEIDIKQKELKILETKVSSWEEDTKKATEDIYKVKDAKYDIEKEEVKIKENLNLDKKLSIDLKDKLESLNHKYDSLNFEYLALKSKVKINDLASKVKEIAENEKKVEILNKDIAVFSKEKEELDLKLRDNTSLFNEIDKKFSNLVQMRDTKYKEIKSKEDELNKIAKGISPSKLLQSTLREIDRITNNEKNLHEELFNKKQEFDENSKSKSSKDGILSQAKKQLEIKNETLKDLLIQNKFDSTNTVEKSILPLENKNKYKGEIEYFDEETKYLIVKISDLNKKLDGRSVKAEEFENLLTSITIYKNEIADLRKEIGSKENELRNIEKSLASIKALSKEIKKAEHEASLLDEINKLIMGNKFVEYVATNQLKYIALEASKRLHNITRGRYALEIDENLNFIMRDNMNGGQRRSVDSLSGGETFLTSLSLALALSSQIQLKGNSPLEFFFLDEGFGSLDTDLLDVVMESLENLHSDQLSIGIISHVEELKNRVPVKLLVSPCDVGKGSRVKIEYS